MKFWYPGILVCIKSAKEGSIAFPFVSGKYPGHDPGVCLLACFVKLVVVVVMVKVLGIGQVVVLDSDSSFFCLQIIMKIKILNSIKTKVP